MMYKLTFMTDIKCKYICNYEVNMTKNQETTTNYILDILICEVAK